MRFKSITSRIILAVMPIIVLVTILTIGISHNIMSKQVDAQFNERMVESIAAAELSIDAELMMNANIARSLAIYAESCSLESIDNGELVNFLIYSILSNLNTVGGGIWFEPYSLYQDQQYFGPYVYINNDEAFYTEDYAGTVDYHSQEWYTKGKASGPEIVWSGVYYDLVADVLMITATQPFYADGGSFLGVATADMAMTDIKKIAADISVGETGRAFILGDKGEYITFFDDSKNIDLLISEDEDPELVQLGEYILSHESGSTSVNWNGADCRVFFTTIAETGWHLVMIIDTAEVGHSTNSIVLSLAHIPLVGLIVITFFISLTARYLRRVTSKVNHFADKAASGDLRERITITEHDEFGVMEDRLNKMMDNMAEMTAQSNQAALLAQAANQAKTNFLSKMSHEMRTPMNAIIGMVQVAQQSDDEERRSDCLKKINVASKNLLALINDVLDMAKIEANKMNLESVGFSVRGVFDDIIDIFCMRINEKNLTFSADVEDSVPDIIWSDQFRYQQVVTNLLSNAVKFTPDGKKITINAKVVAETETTITLETTVTDTGIGIAPDAMRTLFTSFEQADSSISRRYGGTGLGLTISKNLVELMGGEISCSSEEHFGSAFTFTIVAEKSGEGEEKKRTKTPQDRIYDFTGIHLLLVEDIEINREIVAALLENTGIAIDYAVNGIQACKLFAIDPEKYDLIFMDIQMPLMDGLTATQKIRKTTEGKTVPIIAMSANAFQEDVETSLQAGMNGHMAKPIDVNIMLETIYTYAVNKPEPDTGKDIADLPAAADDEEQK